MSKQGYANVGRMEWKFGLRGGRFQAAKADGGCKWREAKHTDPAPVDRWCSEPIGLETVLALGWGDRRRARGQSETVENFPSRVGRVNGGEDSQAFFAAGTFEHVQGPHALHQFRPNPAEEPPVSRPLAQRIFRRRKIGNTETVSIVMG